MNIDNHNRNLVIGSYLPDALWENGGDERDGELLTTLYIERYAGPRKKEALRAHDFWELTYVMGGEGYVVSQHGEVFLAAGDGILLPPRYRHFERLGPHQFDTLWLGIRGDLAAHLGLAKKALRLANGHTLNQWAEQIWLWRQRETGPIGRELDALTEFFVRAFVRMASQGDSIRGKPWLNQVRDYIDKHISEDLAVEDMAAAFSCSAGHFHRLFRQLSGETPLQYMTRHRLEVALLYLRRSSLTIREIAEKVGFSDPLYFSRVFHRRFGCPPSKAASLDEGRYTE